MSFHVLSYPNKMRNLERNMTEESEKLNVVLIGDEKVGKSALAIRVCVPVLQVICHVCPNFSPSSA